MISSIYMHKVGMFLLVEIQAAEMKFWMTCKFALVEVVYFLLVFSNHKGSASPVMNYTKNDLYAMQQLWGAWNQSSAHGVNNLVGWNTLSPPQNYYPCSPFSPWQGVFCHAKRKLQSGMDWDIWIVGLRLNGANLQGVLPAAIGNLSNLVSLTLTRNPNLTGALPDELGNMNNLFELDLHGNGFTGSIPKFSSEAFIFLQSLDLSDNKLSGGLPDNNTISFQTIQTMNISRNNFWGGVPLNSLKYLHHIVSADFSFNNFNGALPDTYLLMLHSCKSWRIQMNRDYSSNNFNGCLTNIQAHALNYLNVSRNQLHGGINASTFINVTSLTTLDLSKNIFSGPIPNLATSLPALKHLDLSYNNFDPSPYPSWTANLSNLQVLMLRGLSLSGEIPSNLLTSFQNMTRIDLDDNNFGGTLDLAKILSTRHAGGTSELTLSISNNNIIGVFYNDYVSNLRTLNVNLKGNPYCNIVSKETDLKRCVCSQQCIDSGQINASNKKTIIISTTVVGGFLLSMILLTTAFIHWKSKRDKCKIFLEVQHKFAEYEVKPTIYTYNELRVATQDFQPDAKLGKGGYGTVYKGVLSNGNMVAVKRLFIQAQQTMDAFLNEVVLVAGMRHWNLVKLRGCCLQKDQRLLVYEYVENCDLHELLFGHKRGTIIMSWLKRLNICLGVAHGLHYLHALAQPRIIHRDIKASNVLLDGDLNPKIADFGLALLFPDEKSNIMMSKVAGTRGYLAPEYATMGQLSEKVDVYSFGVLLLEIISGRSNIDTKLPLDKIYLLEYAWRLHDEGKLMVLVDPTMSLQSSEDAEVRRVINIALLCVYANPNRRPSMAGVVAMLQGNIAPEVQSSMRYMSSCKDVNLKNKLGLGSVSFGLLTDTLESQRLYLLENRASRPSQESLLSDLTMLNRSSKV